MEVTSSTFKNYQNLEFKLKTIEVAHFTLFYFQYIFKSIQIYLKINQVSNLKMASDLYVDLN